LSPTTHCAYKWADGVAGREVEGRRAYEFVVFMLCCRLLFPLRRYTKQTNMWSSFIPHVSGAVENGEKETKVDAWKTDPLRASRAPCVSALRPHRRHRYRRRSPLLRHHHRVRRPRSRRRRHCPPSARGRREPLSFATTTTLRPPSLPLRRRWVRLDGVRNPGRTTRRLGCLPRAA